jgi:hypothetical protein
MVLEDAKHAAQVDAWIKRVPDALAPRDVVPAFEEAFAALRRRTQVTLGVVTLSAIVHRVLHDVSKDFPLLAVLKIDDGSRLHFHNLRKPLSSQDMQLLREGMRAFLVRFLTLVGTLTGQILTPMLYRALDEVQPQEAAGRREPENAPSRGEKRRRGATR